MFGNFNDSTNSSNSSAKTLVRTDSKETDLSIRYLGIENVHASGIPQCNLMDKTNFHLWPFLKAAH